MKTFKQHLNEKTEYYLDTSKDDTENMSQMMETTGT